MPRDINEGDAVMAVIGGAILVFVAVVYAAGMINRDEIIPALILTAIATVVAMFWLSLFFYSFHFWFG